MKLASFMNFSFFNRTVRVQGDSKCVCVWDDDKKATDDAVARCISLSVVKRRRTPT